MKSKYDWFDDNWNPDVKLSTIIIELLLPLFLPLAYAGYRGSYL